MLNICMCPSVRQHVLDTLSLSRCQYISEGNIEVKAVTNINTSKSKIKVYLQQNFGFEILMHEQTQNSVCLLGCYQLF